MNKSILTLVAVALLGAPVAAAAQTDRGDNVHTRIERSDGQVVDVVSTPEGTTVHVDGEWQTSTNDASNDRHADYIDRWTRDDADAHVTTEFSEPSAPDLSGTLSRYEP
jgi:Ni/Co efflux regulator RcnB